MPTITTSLGVAIQGAEVRSVGLSIHIQPVSVGLDVAVAETAQGTATGDVAVAQGAVPAVTSMDVNVAEGGAASQLFALDTQVTTPVIVGDHTVTALAVTYGVANLDEDVVAITLGPGSLGVTGISGFLNNGDGTGSFVASFDAVPTRTLTIIVTDDVDNESAESPAFLVWDADAAILNDTLKIAPQATVWTDTCNRLVDAVPRTSFILQRQITVPYSINTTPFALTAVTPNDPVEIAVRRRGLPGDPDETQRYVVTPESPTEVVHLRLGRGVNVVTAVDQQGRSDTVIVAATTYATILCAYAREIYNVSQVRLEEQSNAIFSPTSTRIAEPLIPFSDLIPDVKSLQTLATKLVIRSLVNDAGEHRGVRDILAALTLSTPIFLPQENQDAFEPLVVPLYNDQEAFGGVEAHVWPANLCVQQWLAFIHYLHSQAFFQIINISEGAVVFRDDTGAVRRHVFDFTRDACSVTNLALESLCFDSVDVTVQIFSATNIVVCAAQYPFDMTPTPTHPITPLGDEVGVPLALDPGFSGYVDFSLTDHWDGNNPLDSQGPNPAAGSGLPLCAYDGYLVGELVLASDNVTADNAPGITAVYDVQRARAVTLDLLLDMANTTVTTTLDLNIGLPLKTTDLDLVVKSTETATVGLTIAITL